jgi:hypothetical protein
MKACILFIVLCVAVDAAYPDGQWTSQILLESEHGMGGAAIGDLDPESPGNEVAVVNGAGEVWMVRYAGNGWRPQRIHKGAGELIMCAIGDSDPRYGGNELIGVGMVSGQESRTGPGQVVMIRNDAGKWIATQVFQDDHMIHGVAIGDVSSRYDGNEIVACGFNHRVTLLAFDGRQWQPEVIYVANDRMKIGAIADVLPERDGLEVVVSGSDGNAVVLWEAPLGWKHEVIFSDQVGQSRLALGEPGVFIGGDKGKLTLARRQGGRWVTEFLARDTGRIRGVAIADVDGDVPGAELYACGYSRNVTQLVQDADGFWRSKVIFTAQRPLHHLVAGDIDPRHAGLELVTCGHGGRLIALIPSE